MALTHMMMGVPKRGAGIASVLALLLVAGAQVGRAEEVRVTVVAILASDSSTKIEPDVKCIAEEVRKLEPSLTGFRMARTTCKSVTVGKKDTFPLVDDEVVTVVVNHGQDKDKRVGLTIKPPSLGEITYTTICGKCFPIVTRHQTKDKERLIIAIMVRPCKGKH